MRFLKWRIEPWGLVFSAGFWAGVGTIAGLFGRYHWFPDLAAHFRPQYLLLLAPLTLIQLVRRKFRSASIFGVLALVNVAFVAPAYLSDDPPATLSHSLRLLLANVHTDNTRHELVLDLVRDADPDVILLLEVNDAWVAAMNALTNTHPHVVVRPREDNFGIALYSRTPFLNASTEFLGEGWVPSIRATYLINGQTVDLLGVHALPPWGREPSRIRNNLLQAIPAFVASFRGAKVVVGDLNCTPWSGHFRRLLKDSGLRSSLHGYGIQPTWPAPMPAVLRIPLDHALVSPNVRVANRRMGPYIGSDHYPLVLDLSFSLLEN